MEIKNTVPVRLKNILITFLFLCFACVSCVGKEEDISYLERSGFAFDTVINLRIYGKKDETILDEAMKLCEEMELIFSAHHENSELYRLNHRKKGERTFLLSEDLQIVMKEALEISELTDGVFDITIQPVLSLWDFQSEKPTLPLGEEIQKELKKVDYKKIQLSDNEITFLDDETRIDLGAIAKGYIADKVSVFLKEKGVKNALINLGGNVLVIGEKPMEKEFKVGIRMPFASQKEMLGYLTLNDASVVSSGVYERHFELDGVNYHHILDVKNGYPIQNGLAQVTIVAKSSMLADALSTSCFSLGVDRGMELIRGFSDVHAYFVDENGEITYSEKARDLLHIQN